MKTLPYITTVSNSQTLSMKQCV